MSTKPLGRSPQFTAGPLGRSAAEAAALGAEAARLATQTPDSERALTAAIGKASRLIGELSTEVAGDQQGLDGARLKAELGWKALLPGAGKKREAAKAVVSALEQEVATDRAALDTAMKAVSDLRIRSSGLAAEAQYAKARAESERDAQLSINPLQQRTELEAMRSALTPRRDLFHPGLPPVLERGLLAVFREPKAPGPAQRLLGVRAELLGSPEFRSLATKVDGLAREHRALEAMPTPGDLIRQQGALLGQISQAQSQLGQLEFQKSQVESRFIGKPGGLLDVLSGDDISRMVSAQRDALSKASREVNTGLVEAKASLETVTARLGSVANAAGSSEALLELGIVANDGERSTRLDAVRKDLDAALGEVTRWMDAHREHFFNDPS
ncbi:MAG: hypothetical protein K1X89_24415 [Myxococcaceae bacterium]|nr:hypothetical protein [Myxococcaceae bacterium]